ncbi:S9 family peptidase [candidate division KSB1 bacterium]|nr:MAG: S9 family peptidase [candidate division KSB1 bacterium]
MLKQPKNSAALYVQAKDFAELKHPRALAVSPDGARIAFTLSWCDYEKNKYFASLHVLDTRTNRVQQWTRGEFSDRSPVWSPDGSRLAFLRHDKGLDRIYIISRDGGEAEDVFHAWGSFAAVKWADDFTLIVKFRKNDSTPEIEKAIAEGKEPQAKTPVSRRITRLYWRMDGEGILPQDSFQLYKLDLATKQFTRLTQGKTDIGAWDVSQDGTFLAYVTNIHRDPDLHPFHQQVIHLNLKSGKKKDLPCPLGEKYTLAISPNGKYLVYIGHHNMNPAWETDLVHPWLLDLRSGKVRDLTPRFDRQANDEMLGDIGHGGGAPLLLWSADSRQIYYQITDEGDVYLARAGLKPGKPERMWPDKGHVASATINGKSLALLYLNLDNLGELHFCGDCTANRLAFEKVATFNTAYLKSRVFGKVRDVHFRSGDGAKLHGWLITPPNFNPRKKYPAILQVHGGPRMQYGRTFFHEMHYLAAQGFVMFYTNPRGSQGYGQDFAAATVAAWGTDDFNDVMAAADYLEEQPFVDKKKIGITGGSYGGYMTAYAIGRTHRFRAAAAQRGVMNLATMQSTSDIGWHVRNELGGYYWENPKGYEAMSPITYARNIRTPLLVIHNEGDLRCAIEQAEQLWTTVKILGKAPVEFLRFPEESHGLSRGGRPDRRVARLEAIAEWMKRWMK